MEKSYDNMNAPMPRPDEKRRRLLPFLVVLVGITFVALGFLAQKRPGGRIFSEYRFNRAVVTNNEDSIDKPAATPIRQDNKNKKAAPTKTKKKDANYCPT